MGGLTEEKRAAATRRGRETSGCNPYAFIVGCPRSGTTLLRRLVEAHSDFAMPRTRGSGSQSAKRSISSAKRTPRKAQSSAHVRFYAQKGVRADGTVTLELVDVLFDNRATARRRTVRAPLLSAKHAWLPVSLGLPNWRSEMPTEDMRRFEAAAGDLLDELGYERLAGRPSHAHASYARALEARFVAEPPSRMRELATA